MGELLIEDIAILLNKREINVYSELMEEMANESTQQLGERTPGERGKYETKHVEAGIRYSAGPWALDAKKEQPVASKDER